MPNGAGPVRLFVSTKKGLWVLESDAHRESFRLEGPSFLGHIVNHTVLDPRDRRTALKAARTGHLGPTIFRSDDGGKSWKEASRPPMFPKQPEGSEKPPRSVSHTFAVVPGHASEPGVWYAGTSPEGLFRSEDAGESWAPIDGFNDSPWAGAPPPPGAPGPQEGTPDGDILHSIVIDPRDPAHLYVAMSANLGGVFESRDKGASWQPLNRGCQLAPLSRLSKTPPRLADIAT